MKLVSLALFVGCFFGLYHFRLWLWCDSSWKDAARCEASK